MHATTLTDTLPHTFKFLYFPAINSQTHSRSLTPGRSISLSCVCFVPLSFSPSLPRSLQKNSYLTYVQMAMLIFHYKELGLVGEGLSVSLSVIRAVVAAFLPVTASTSMFPAVLLSPLSLSDPCVCLFRSPFPLLVVSLCPSIYIPPLRLSACLGSFSLFYTAFT